MKTEALHFDQFQLLPKKRVLLDDGKPVPLGSRALDILTVLLENAGEIIAKETLFARVWPGITVDESSLRVHVSAIRRALRDGHAGRRYISNIPGRGYSFVAPVEPSAELTPRIDAVLPKIPQFGRLPTQLARIIGRDDIIRSLGEQQASHRLMTIAGPGGIGKTTVALALAKVLSQSYLDGVIFVDLAPVRNPSFVPGTLAAMLNISLPVDDPVLHLASILQEKRILIVLDSCEHVIDAVANLVEGLLRHTAKPSILTTSREPLRIEGEWVQRIPGLAAPKLQSAITAQEALQFPAVQLFADRAADSRGGYSLSDADAPFVCEICRKLDGIALAIELAAGRANTISIHELAMQMDDCFRLLKHGRRTALPRHKTLRAALDWSYDCLLAQEQLLLNRLSIFPGDFTFDAAVAVCAGGEIDEGDVSDGIVDLVAKSLIVADIGDGDASYRLLDTTRSYALEKLVASGDWNDFAARHAAHTCALFERAADLWEKNPSDKWVENVVPQIENLRAALVWAFSADGDPGLGVALTIAAVPLWSQLSLTDESLQWVEHSLQASARKPDQPRRHQMQLYAALGGLQMYVMSSMKAAKNALELALGIAVELGDVDYQLRLMRALWAESVNLGDFRDSLSLAERFQELAQLTGRKAEQLLADRLTGTALHYLGEQERSETAIERMLSRYHFSVRSEDLVRYQFSQEVSARLIRSRILWLQGHTESALCDIDENMTEALALDHTLSLCNVLVVSACPISLLARDHARAQHYIALLRERTAPRTLDTWSNYVICFEADMEIDHGNVKQGLNQLQGAIDKFRLSDCKQHLTSFLTSLARGLLLANRQAEAAATIAEAIAICDRTGEGWCLPELHRWKGEIALAKGEPSDFTVAQMAFRHAMNLARQQGALAWELRAASSLARHSIETGQAKDAYAILRPVYERYTEGFDRPDLMEAADLLSRTSS